MIITLALLLKQTGNRVGGDLQNGVKYGSDWVTENLVVSLVLHCDC